MLKYCHDPHPYGFELVSQIQIYQIRSLIQISICLISLEVFVRFLKFLKNSNF